MLIVFHQLNRNGLAANRNEVTEPSKSYLSQSVNLICFSKSDDSRVF